MTTTTTTLMNTTALLGVMTAAERAKGRYMRAPDGHGDGAGGAPADGAAAEGASAEAAPRAETGASAPAAEDTSDEALIAELEREFGPVEPPATGEKDPGEGSPGEPKAEEPKVDPAIQSRFDEMTAGRREAERREAEARRDAEYWRSKAEAATPEKPKGDDGAVDPDAEPKPENYEFGEADNAYIRDTARYHARQEFREQQQQAEHNARVASLEANWQGNVAKATERYPDFAEKVTATAAKGEWPCPPIVAIGIQSSDVGPDVAYHLATNREEATRIAKLTPIEQAREFGKLEYRFEMEAKSRANPASEARKVTQAPTPPKGQTRGAGGQFATAADTDDFAAFDKMADGILKG